MAVKRAPHRRAGGAARAGEERYRALVEHLPVGVYRTTPDGRFIEANPALARMLGVRSPSELLRYNVSDFYVTKHDRDEHLAKLATKPRYFTEFELRRAGGRKFWVRDYCQAVKGADGKVLFYDGILDDITKGKDSERKLNQALAGLRASNAKNESLSLTDHLTGLNNRRGFFTLGQQQMKIAKRLRKESFLVYIDVDGLKKVNDTLGHAAGDRLLQALAGMLRETLRESDVIARIGGDEFAVLAMRSQRGSEKGLLKRLGDRIRAYNNGRPKRLRWSASMGVVRHNPREVASLEECLDRADFLMYHQKRAKADGEA
ncbi:MAG TPA: sensor domain-containing diguanylate cyclase [Terriglobales bacterium]|nr:sensor domain-containing diguanylate cyclase [Terriglobales bacterium]